MASQISGTPRKDLHITPDATSSLAGKQVAVVGGTDGIGRAFAKYLAGRGASVVVVGRTFRDEGAANVTFMKADLSSMKEAQRVGRELSGELDIVHLTTGIMTAPTRETTSEGIERDLAISFLSRLAIVRELAPRLKRRSRVFVMGFPGTEQKADVDDLNAERTYEAFPQHMATVAGNEALVVEGARRWGAGNDVDFFGLNPGLIKSAIRSNYMGAGSLKHRISEWFIGLVMPSTDAYAKRVLPVLLSKDLDGKAPVMFNQKGGPIETSRVMGDGYAQRLIEAAERLLARAVG